MLGADRPGFWPSLSLSPDVWSWGIYRSILALRFLIYRMETDDSNGNFTELREVLRIKLRAQVDHEQMLIY